MARRGHACGSFAQERAISTASGSHAVRSVCRRWLEQFHAPTPHVDTGPVRARTVSKTHVIMPKQSLKESARQHRGRVCGLWRVGSARYPYSWPNDSRICGPTNLRVGSACLRSARSKASRASVAATVPRPRKASKSMAMTWMPQWPRLAPSMLQRQRWKRRRRVKIRSGWISGRRASRLAPSVRCRPVSIQQPSWEMAHVRSLSN